MGNQSGMQNQYFKPQSQQQKPYNNKQQQQQQQMPAKIDLKRNYFYEFL